MLLQKVCAGTKNKFNEQKSSFGIAQKSIFRLTKKMRNTNLVVKEHRFRLQALDA